jgi:hypothetical protein
MFVLLLKRGDCLADIYEIRKDIPIPTPGGKDSLCAAIRRMSYGDSIVVPVEKHLGLHTSARSVGAKVKTRSNRDGTVTVWRIDSPVVGDAKQRNPDPLQRNPDPLQRNPDPLLTIARPETRSTVANPALGLPEGYYIQEPYGPSVWVEGKPSAKKDIFS